MIRLILLSTGFIGVTAALLWTLGQPPAPDHGTMNEVSRSEPTPLTFSSVVPGPTASTIRPKARPVVLTAPAEPDAEPPVIAKSVEPAPAQTEALDPVTNALRAMSYGIVSELQKPVQPSAPATTVASTANTFSGQTYTVQQGDSLPGIAFRFFGTTVAYLDILAANEDVLTDPGDLQAGMVLRIPTNP